MSYTRKEWADALLAGLGNTSPSPEVENWLIGWTDFETSSPPGAAYNLLNTTQAEPGATAFNHFGPNGEYSVKNYTDFNQGIQANITALRNGYYPVLEQALASNDFHTLVSSGAITNELGTWGTGKSGATIETAAGRGANQSFSGVATGVQPNPNPNNTTLPQGSQPNGPDGCPAAIQAVGLCTVWAAWNSLNSAGFWARVGLGTLGVVAIGVGLWSGIKAVQG